ncbi:MAG: calcium-binding protein, partial [Pirellulales bacterium]
MIGVSVADVLGEGAVSFAAGLQDAIHTVRDTARNIGELQDKLNEEVKGFLTDIGAPVPAADIITMTYANSAFDFDFHLEYFVMEMYSLDLDIAQLQLDQWLGFDPADLLDIEVSAELELEARAALHLGFGFDLSNVMQPVLYVDQASGISASVHGQATDLDFKVGFDVAGITLGLLAEDGSATIDVGFYADLGDPSADGDGDGVLDFGEVRTAFQAEVYGDAMLDLPLYFPIKALPLGGTTADRDGDGFADNALHADIGFSINENLQLSTNYDFVLPSFSLDFGIAAALLALLDDPVALLAGVEGFFSAIDATADGIDYIDLPLIGGEPFDDLANALRGLRTGVLGDKSGEAYTSGLGLFLQEAAASGTSTSEAVLNAIRQALYDGLSPIDGELFRFVVPVYDEDGAEQYDSTGKLVTELPASADDIELLLTANGLLTFNLKFGGVLVGEGDQPASLPIDFSGGLPGLNIDIDAALQARIDYLMGIGLGIGNLAPAGAIIPQFGVFLDTSGINEAGEEISLDVTAGLAPGSRAEGTLGFLAMEFVDVNPIGSGLRGHFGLDIKDAGGDGALTLGEKPILEMNASAYAEADFSAVVSTTAGDVLPSVSTTIHYDQQLGDLTISTDTGITFDTGSPQVVLENVTLDVGSMFDSFLGDTFSVIYDIVSPLKPVVDLLLLEIPMGGIADPPIRMIDIARLKLPAKVVETATKVLKVVQSTIQFLETVQDLGGVGEISFGDFNLTEKFLEDPEEETSDEDVASSTMDDSMLPADQKEKLQKVKQGPDQKGLDDGASRKKKKKSNFKRNSGKTFSIPVLENPASLLDFVTGRGDADLFWYDLPDLDLSFEYQKTFMIFPGLNAGFFGEIAARTNFDFGFDTRGLRQWMDTDFDLAESWRIFNGFYLDDHGLENTAEDADELTFSLAIGAVASLGIGGLIEAGVKGGLEATIGFDLNDKETAFLNDLPVGDGKFYGAELVERIGQGPQCVFDVHGELKVFLEAFFWIGLDLGFSKITLFEAEERFVDEIIASFEWECVLEAPDDIARLVTDGGGINTLELEYFNDPGIAQTYNVDVMPVDDNLTLTSLATNGLIDTEYYTRPEEVGLREQLAGYRANNSGEDVILVSTGLRSKLFLANGVDRIVLNGSPQADQHNLKRLNGRVDAVVIDGGGGDDVITLIGDAENEAKLTSLWIDGEAGHDYISLDGSMLGPGTGSGPHAALRPGTAGNFAYDYLLSGDAGDDRIKLIGTSTSYGGLLLDGGDGDDVIMGKDGPEHVQGGRGFDVIMTYDGDDLIDGGDEFDADIALFTNEAGVVRTSTVYQAGGAPFAHYDNKGRPATNAAGTQLVNLAATPFKVRTFHGDIIAAGGGNDTIFGGHGWDELDGGEGVNTINGEEGNDVIDAGTGNVTVYAGPGDDTVSWVYDPESVGSPTLQGGAGLKDVLDVTVPAVTVDDADNTVNLTQVGATTAARMDIDGKAVLLDGIEEVKLDVESGADNVAIGDLLDTSIRVVDVTLGSSKATMWQADRDGDGNFLVYPYNYDSLRRLVAEPDAGGNFYRYKLDNEGVHLFNADGTPQTREVVNTSQIVASFSHNSVQQVWLTPGLDEVTLFYGETPAAENSVVIGRSMTAAEIETQIETLADPGKLNVDVDVTVTGAGSESTPWEVTFQAAPQDAGEFRQLRYRYDVQEYAGNLEFRSNASANPPSGNRIGRYPHADSDQTLFFYRYDLENGGTFLFEDDGSPRLQSVVTPAGVEPGADGSGRENSTQNVWLKGGLERVNLFYGYDPDAVANGRTGDNTVAIYGGMPAANVQHSIETLTDVAPGGVGVTGAGTQADPWVVTFTAATRDAGDDYLKLAHHYDLQSYLGSLTQRDDTRVFDRFYRLGDAEATYLFENGQPALVSGSTVMEQLDHNQVQLLALDSLQTAGGILWYGNEGVAVNPGDSAVAVQNRLLRLATVADVQVSGGGTTANPWQFRFAEAAKEGNDDFLVLKLSLLAHQALDPATV